MLELCVSEYVDVLSIETGDSEDSQLLAHAYEELVEARAVDTLNIDWPLEKQEVQEKQVR